MTELNKTLSHAEAVQYSPLTLAFFGDSVYEELVRSELILTANMPARKLHTHAVKLVCASYQARAAHYLCENAFDEQEEYIYKRGRNANGINAPKKLYKRRLPRCHGAGSGIRIFSAHRQAAAVRRAL